LFDRKRMVGRLQLDQWTFAERLRVDIRLQVERRGVAGNAVESQPK
jgi:hypothetical protein